MLDRSGKKKGKKTQLVSIVTDIPPARQFYYSNTNAETLLFVKTGDKIIRLIV